MTAPDDPIVHCRRCGIGVPASKVDLPNRCISPDCPLNPPEVNARLRAEAMRSKEEAA